jgi:hypothetical protein
MKALREQLEDTARSLVVRERFDSDHAFEEAVRATVRDWIYNMLRSGPKPTPEHVREPAQEPAQEPGLTGTQPIPGERLLKRKTPSGRILFRLPQPQKAQACSEVEISCEALLRIGRAAGWVKTAGEMGYGAPGTQVPLSHIYNMLRMLPASGEVVPRLQAFHRKIKEMSQEEMIRHRDLKEEVSYPTVKAFAPETIWSLLTVLDIEWLAQYIMPAFDPAKAGEIPEPETEIPVSAPAETYDQDEDTVYYQRADSEKISLRISKSDWEELGKMAGFLRDPEPREFKVVSHHSGAATCLASVTDGNGNPVFKIDIDDEDPEADNREAWTGAWNGKSGGFDLAGLKEILVRDGIMDERDILTQ